MLGDCNWPSETDKTDFITWLDDIQFEWEEEQVTNDGELKTSNAFFVVLFCLSQAISITPFSHSGM